jgi:hypothetical protein
MHGLYVRNAVDVEIIDMKIIYAHGDGLNLRADLRLQNAVSPELQHSTKAIRVRDSQFLRNKRSGIAFQRNVEDVTITRNLFRNSGTDQDLDMEPTGGDGDKGPINIDITDNTFERARADGTPANGKAVTLGANGTKEGGQNINFLRNFIVPVPGAKTAYGGCIVVNDAVGVTIKDNKVIGTDDCFPVQARKVGGLTIEGNELHGHRNRASDEGVFQPAAVVWISVDTGKVDGDCVSPKPCAFRIHYADDVTIRNNRIFQHVQLSSGIALEGADNITISENTIVATNDFTPVGRVPENAHWAAVAMTLGVHPLGVETNSYLEERKEFNTASLDSNMFIDFTNSVLIKRYPGITIDAVALTRNSLSSKAANSRGFYLLDDQSAPNQSALVTRYLLVDGNRFGCGFVQVPPALGSNAFVRPPYQPNRGDIGTAIPGNPTPCLKPIGRA